MSCCGEFNLDEMQEQVAGWAEYNFGSPLKPDEQFLGLTEELGELAHARLKRLQGIRGTKEEHDAAERDAVGDIAVFLMNYCSSRGESLATIIQEVWKVIQHRDFKKFPKNGLTE